MVREGSRAKPRSAVLSATTRILTASFPHIHRAISPPTDANLGETIKMFGQDFSRQRAMILTVTHLHEHLGQLIAYARANNVTPPWSR